MKTAGRSSHFWRLFDSDAWRASPTAAPAG